MERPLREKLQGPLGRWMMENNQMLRRMNDEGPFKISLTKLGAEFNPKAERGAGNDNKAPAPAAKKIKPPSAG